MNRFKLFNSSETFRGAPTNSTRVGISSCWPQQNWHKEAAEMTKPTWKNRTSHCLLSLTSALFTPRACFSLETQQSFPSPPSTGPAICNIPSQSWTPPSQQPFLPLLTVPPLPLCLPVCPRRILLASALPEVAQSQNTSNCLQTARPRQEINSAADNAARSVRRGGASLGFSAEIMRDKCGGTV